MAALDFAKELLIEGLSLVYDDGSLTRVTLIDNGSGGFTSIPDTVPVLAQFGAIQEWMRGDPGFSDKTVSIMVIRTDELTIDLESEITLHSQTFMVDAVRPDPTGAVWQCMTHPKPGVTYG